MGIWSYRSVMVPLTEEQIKGVLKRYDTNGDGKLSRKELKQAFRSLGVRYSGWRAFRAMAHADQNGDGFISEDELNDLVKYAKSKGFTIS